MKRKVLALACTLALSAGLLAGCGSSTDTAAEAESTVAAVESTEAAEAESTEAESTETAAEVESKGTITVAATPVPHAEILEAAKDLMAAEGWDLEIVEFTDYVQPNEVVESGVASSIRIRNGMDLVIFTIKSRILYSTALGFKPPGAHTTSKIPIGRPITYAIRVEASVI